MIYGKDEIAVVLKGQTKNDLAIQLLLLQDKLTDVRFEAQDQKTQLDKKNTALEAHNAKLIKKLERVFMFASKLANIIQLQLVCRFPNACDKDGFPFNYDELEDFPQHHDYKQNADLGLLRALYVVTRSIRNESDKRLGMWDVSAKWARSKLKDVANGMFSPEEEQLILERTPGYKEASDEL